MEYQKHRLEYPKNKKLILEKLTEEASNLVKFSTFSKSNDELHFLMNYESQQQSNLLGESYIRDIVWLETEETVGMSGLQIERETKCASWHLLLLKPYASPQLCKDILLEYLSIGKCVLLDQIFVSLPQSFQTLSIILESNGFNEEIDSSESTKYKIDLKEYGEDHRSSGPAYCEFDDKQILCRGCGNNFLFLGEEQTLYFEKGFVSPKRCPKCRLIKKIALQTLHGQGSSDFEESKYNQALRNVCYSWRYKGHCRYASECRYIHEDLSSVSVLYDRDVAKQQCQISPPINNDHMSFCLQNTPSDTTDSAFSSILSSEHHDEFMEAFESPNRGEVPHNTGIETEQRQSNPFVGYALPNYPQVMAPIYLPYTYPNVYPLPCLVFGQFPEYALYSPPSPHRESKPPTTNISSREPLSDGSSNLAT